MSKTFSNLKKGIVVCIVIALAAIMFACDTAPMSQRTTFNPDFSGTRVLTFELSATPVIDDGDDDELGTADDYMKSAPYYRLKKHGDDLKAYLENALSEDSFTKDFTWSVEVEDQTVPTQDEEYKKFYNGEYEPKLLDGSEFVRLSFNFADFTQYTRQLRALASFGNTELTFSSNGKDHGEVTHNYTDPTLLADLDSDEIIYNELGANSRFYYYGLNSKIAKDRTITDHGKMWDADGHEFRPDGTGTGEGDFIKDGIKCKKFELSINGSLYTPVALVQGDDGAGVGNGGDYYDIEVDLAGRPQWKGFFTGPITTTNKSITYTGTNADFRWYAADEDGKPTGEPLTTAKTYTHAFTAGQNGSYKVVGIDGNATYITTMYYKVWTVKFVDAAGTTLGTVVVENGENVPTASIPAVAETREDGYTFTGWDKSTENITADTTLTAQYKAPAPAEEPAPKKGCGGEVTATGSAVAGGILLLAAACMVVAKRKKTNV